MDVNSSGRIRQKIARSRRRNSACPDPQISVGLLFLGTGGLCLVDGSRHYTCKRAGTPGVDEHAPRKFTMVVREEFRGGTQQYENMTLFFEHGG